MEHQSHKWWLAWLGLGLAASGGIGLWLIVFLMGGQHPVIQASFMTKGQLLWAAFIAVVSGFIATMLGIWRAGR